MGNLSLEVVLIIVANVLLSIKGFNDFGFFERYKFNIGSIQNGEYIRYFSAAFLHANFTHLFFNLFTLYMFSNVVVAYMGSINFLIIYFISLFTGNFLAYFFHKHQPYYSAIGASGAVTGILYASILLEPNMSLYLFFIPIPIPAFIFGVGYLFYSIYGMKKQMGNIGHDAHFGGAVGGYFTTLLIWPGLLFDRPGMFMLLAIPIVVLFYLIKTNKL
jgi:membrane associated rhomboid family serine protease